MSYEEEEERSMLVHEAVVLNIQTLKPRSVYNDNEDQWKSLKMWDQARGWYLSGQSPSTKASDEILLA